MKVAIWGSLNYGNFGDDVMNVIFGRHLKSLGCEVRLYRLSERYAQSYSLISSSTLDDLLENVDFCLIGGGSWLESRELGRSYEEDFVELKNKLEEYDVPLYIASIGGDHSSSFANLSLDRRELFGSSMFKGGTVRLASDLKVFEGQGVSVFHFPDIVLQSAQHFLHDARKRGDNNQKFRIAISVGDGSHLRSLIKRIRLFPFLYRKYEIYFLRTHLPEYNLSYEYQHIGGPANLLNYQYTDLESFHKFIQSVDVMICSKLHPGVAALSCGTPFLWVGGYQKTRAFMDSVALSKYEVRLEDVLRSIKARRIEELVKAYPFAELQRQKVKSMGHLDYLTKLTAN